MKATLNLFHSDETFQVSNGIVIGRSSSCDIVIGDESISSKHAQIIEEKGALFIVDLDSKNKLSYMGSKYKKLPIEENLTIKIGDILAYFSFPGTYKFKKELLRLTESLIEKQQIKNPSFQSLAAFKKPIKLIFTQCPQSGSGLRIDYGPYPIGANSSLFLPIIDPKAPGECFTLSPVSNVYEQEQSIAILNSNLSGIKVNQEPISSFPYRLKENDVISLGSIRAKVVT